MKLLRRLFLSCYLSVRRRREHEDATSRREATLQPDRQQQGSQVYTNVCTILNLLESFVSAPEMPGWKTAPAKWAERSKIW